MLKNEYGKASEFTWAILIMVFVGIMMVIFVPRSGEPNPCTRTTEILNPHHISGQPVTTNNRLTITLAETGWWNGETCVFDMDHTE
jgi:hypothetical protein